MARTTGFIPALPRSWLGGFIFGAFAGLAGLLFAAPGGTAPDYLREALADFSPDMPTGWTCTVTTVRNGLQMVERYDPTRSADRRWILLLHNGRAPTEEEIEKHARARLPGTATAPQAVFKKGDLDPGRIALLTENDERAVFRCAFRESAVEVDKMLGHLTLRLTVNRKIPYVENFTLELDSPYSPLIGVKMHALRVSTVFSTPEPDRPSLPVRTISRFVGRVLFFPTEENLQITYSDYKLPSAARPSVDGQE